MTARLWTVVAAGALMIVGSVMPWGQAAGITISGIQGDGVITMIIGVLVIIVGVAKRDSQATGVLMGAVAAFAAWIPIRILGALDADMLGNGLLVTLAGGALAVLAAIGMVISPADMAPSDPDD